jgi:hypothetical protein
MARYTERELIATLPDSGVVAGAFTNTNITVNSQGIVTTASNGSAAAAALNDLTDVVLTGPINTQITQFNGANWVNITPILNTITDVIITTPTTSDFLTYNGANWVNTAIDVLISGDIGTTVQAWDAELDAVAALAGTGYIAHTGAGTVAERTVIGADGIVIVNGNGVAGNTTVSVSIDTLPFTDIDPVNDLMMFWNLDVARNEQISIEDAILSATPVLGAASVGTGADVFKGIAAQILEFKEISSNSVGLIVTDGVNDIQIGISATLAAISALAPTDNNFIVGNGASWALETPANARTSLGLGTMATETAADYLLLAGGTMSGAIAMGTSKITGLGEPTLAQDSATKNYVDVNLAVAGDGLVKIGNEIDVVGINGITANANDIELDLAFLDTHTDTLYYTQTELGDTTDATEGASLIGTEAKAGLGAAVTVEAALDYINTQLPFVKTRFRQDISVWNMDITSPTATRAIVNTVEVARFADAVNDAVYKDILLPFDLDIATDITVYIAIGKETAAAGNGRMALAWQHQRTPGFTVDSISTFAPGGVTTVGTLNWVIPAGTFQALDVITLRLTRIGGDAGDTYAAGIDLFAANITQ